MTPISTSFKWWKVTLINLALWSGLFFPTVLVRWRWGLSDLRTAPLVSIVSVASLTVLFLLAQVLVTVVWTPARHLRRVQFVTYQLLPLALGAGIATVMAFWSSLPALMCLILGFENAQTLAVSLALPSGCRFDEVFEDNQRCWIRVTYFQRWVFYRPGSWVVAESMTGIPPCPALDERVEA